MAANPLSVVTLDKRALRVTGMARHEMQEAQAGAGTFDKIIEDEFGLVTAMGRGTLDRNVTYITLQNTNNQRVFIYPNAAGNGLVVTTVAP